MSSHPLTGKVGYMKRNSKNPSAVQVQDMKHVVEAMRFFSIHHYLTVGGLGWSVCALGDVEILGHCLADGGV